MISPAHCLNKLVLYSTNENEEIYHRTIRVLPVVIVRVWSLRIIPFMVAVDAAFLGFTMDWRTLDSGARSGDCRTRMALGALPNMIKDKLERIDKAIERSGG